MALQKNKVKFGLNKVHWQKSRHGLMRAFRHLQRLCACPVLYP